MESLRNQMQHRSIPTTGLSYSAARDNDLFAYRIDLALNLDVLSSGAFKASVLGELRALRKEEVDLILFVREYVQELASAQDVIRTLLEEDVAKADSVIDTAMSEWSAAGYDLSGLVAAECRADGTMHDEIHITNNMMERRVDLASANRSFMHLSRRYVTSARPSRAYARGGERSREAK